LLKYIETNWKYERGFKTRKYDIAFGTINASKTRREQQAKIEKISLVAFLNKEQRKFFINICRRLKRHDNNFYQNKNLHATLFGFGPLNKKDYERILKKIQEFSRIKRDSNITISFDEVRPGTMYLKNKTLRPLYGPLYGMSNGAVIAVGDVTSNENFCNYSNQLSSFLLMDKNIESILGANFRRKFPTVWCTLGYYNKQKEFKIDNDLEYIFRQYDNFNGNNLRFSISEISLVKSRYKNLRYPKLIQKFQL
jgi:hypothetical protein